MKKFFIVLLFIIVLFSIGCKDNNEEVKKKLIINYYDDTTFITSIDYLDNVELYKYSKDNHDFVGWFLDKNFTEAFDNSKVDEYFSRKSINLYAKMEKNMIDFEISLIGKLNNNTVVSNPAFTWENLNNDSGFTITFSTNGKEVLTNTTEVTRFQVAPGSLEFDTEYEVTVVGNNSNAKTTTSFKTSSSYTNTVQTINLVNPYMDNMIIQRNVENIIAGIGPVKQVIRLEIGSDAYYAVSDESGHFEIALPPREGSFDPVTILLTNGGAVQKALVDVLFGDVYLFAGQSNMQWQTQDSDYRETDISNFENFDVRFFCQDIVTSTEKLDSVKNGRWFKPNKFNVGGFSAIATMTGSMLGVELRNECPVGIITAYQGDTNIANWMGQEYYSGNCQTKYLHYNAMVYPLRFARLSGVVWYQGCNNSALGCEYKDLLLKFFKNYRDLFNNQNLPFYVIGLACYDGDSGNNFDFSYVRESQALACAEDDKAFFISTCDDGDPTYIHPRAKRYICERVSKSICSSVYNKDYYAEGPSYKSHTVSGATVTISLNNASGLYAKGEINNLYLAGEDGKYFEAKTKIVGETIVASSEKVSEPKYIKYGFGKSPFVNIFNKDNFSLVPFRTDNYNTNIDLLDYESTDKYYFHPDGSKMEVGINNGNLAITKTNDGKTYGSVRLNKWGAIAYNPQGFRFTIKGTNSGAAISFRAIEGDSYEIWGYKVIDNFEGEQTFTIAVGDFYVMYNKQNNIFEPQKIGYVEVMVEAPGEAKFEVCEARFIDFERSKPMSFNIASVSEGEDDVIIGIGKAIFADNYKVVVTDDSGNELFSKTQDDTIFKAQKSLFEPGKPYYVKATAINELGETNATNTGFVFYLKDEATVIVCNFDFKDQAALDAYVDSSMSVHQGLTCTLNNPGVKIESGGQGWQQFIFKLETGTGKDMTKLTFYADFSNYKGQVIMQLADTSWGVYQYNLDLNEQKEGTFTLEFKDFLKSGTPFTTQTLMWVMFNFSDSVGNGYIILDDVSLSK